MGCLSWPVSRSTWRRCGRACRSIYRSQGPRGWQWSTGRTGAHSGHVTGRPKTFTANVPRSWCNRRTQRGLRGRYSKWLSMSLKCLPRSSCWRRWSRLRTWGPTSCGVSTCSPTATITTTGAPWRTTQADVPMWRCRAMISWDGYGRRARPSSPPSTWAQCYVPHSPDASLYGTEWRKGCVWRHQWRDWHVLSLCTPGPPTPTPWNRWQRLPSYLRNTTGVEFYFLFL